jgi:hypothetical protein
MAKELMQLTDEQLLAEAKRTKKYKTYDAVIFGFLIGVSIYSIINHGFGLLTFLPLVYLPIAGKNNKRREAIQNQLQERGLS